MPKNILKHTTRGGQVILHNLRMIGQVLYKVMIWTLPSWLLASVAWFYCITDVQQRYIGEQWLSAQFYLFVDGKKHWQKFIKEDGYSIVVYSSQLIDAPFVNEALDVLIDKAKHAVYVGFFGYLCVVISVLIWLRRRGDKHSQSKHIKGDYLADVLDVKTIMRSKKVEAQLVIGKEKLPLPLFSETQHYLFHGTTGSGKSTGIKELLNQIRTRGERAIIYDKSCNLVEEFYQPAVDKIMNPFDERGASWSIWKECRDKAEFESYAAAQIPMPLSTQDPFWVNASRTIFAAAAFRMRDEKNPKILPLLRNLLAADLNELQSLLKGTVAETLISEKTEKTAISIKSVLATYLKSLCYIKDDDNPFSIREWIQNDQANSWLFISSLGNKHEVVKPLITAWLDIAINELLSLSKNASRRIWIILDEVTSLHQLPYLKSGLSEARKFGGCFVLGLLSSAELADVYGHNGAKAISTLLNTRFMFRQPDPEIAMWSAKNLGTTTQEEVREGFSYGANTIRDGVSVNRDERTKPVVTDSEIMCLDNLACYARLPGQYPIIKLTFPYIKRVALNKDFIPRQFDQDDLRGEVLGMMDAMDTKSNTSAQEPKKSNNKKAKTLKTLDREVSHVFDD